MKSKEVKKVLNAGRSYMEHDVVQYTVMLIAIVVDAILFYISLESTIVERWTLNLIVTISGCFVVDVSPLILSNLLYKELDKKFKTVVCSVLCFVLTVGLVGFFLIRWNTRYSLLGGSLGLFGETSSSAIDAVAFVMGILPMLSSVVVFAFGVMAHDPNKREKDLILAAHGSRERQLKLLKNANEYGSNEDCQTRMQKYHEDMMKIEEELLEKTEIELNEDANMMLAMIINANADEITKIMEV